MTRKKPEDLRSARWFLPDDFRSFGHRSRMNQMGYAAEDYVGKPVIAIVNTWSDLNQCHAHFKERVEDVKRGVLQAGGFPVELPAISLSESKVKPTTMLYRNFLAMETEELIRSHPVDGVVLMGGCDKTTPGLLLGATSAGVPAIFVPAGPMLRGNWHGKVLGSGSDAFKYWDERRAGNISDKDWSEMEVGIARSYGVCMTMGTASTMTALAEAIGMTLPGASSIPAADSEPYPHVRGRRPAHRRDGLRRSRAGEDPDRGCFPQCHRRRHGDGLLDERRHPSPRHGAPRRPCHRPRRFRRREPNGAGDRQYPPERRQIPDGGFLLRRRPAGADEPAEGYSGPRADQRLRKDLGEVSRRSGDLQRRRHPSPRQAYLRRRRARGAARQPRARTAAS